MKYFSPLPTVALLIAPALLPSCSAKDTSAQQIAQATGAKTREASQVRTEPVVRRDMLQTLELSTNLESENAIELRPRRAGTIVEVLAEEGDRVNAGQVLARLEDRHERLSVRELEVALEEAGQATTAAELAMEEARAQLAKAKLAADQAERDHQRNARLFEGNDDQVASALSRQALEAGELARDQALADSHQLELGLKRAELDLNQARTAVDRAEVALQRSQAELDEMVIVAPFDAVVAERSVRVGQNVGTEPVFMLTDPLKLRAVFFRPQRELALFATASGEPLEVRAVAEALPGVEFEGEIVRVAPTIDATSGNFRITAVLDNSMSNDAGKRLLAGMLVRLEITTERHENALVVPKRAVRREGDRTYLFAESDGRVRRVDFEEGFTDDDNVEVLLIAGSTLEAGDSVVVVGSRDLEDGAAVRVETAYESGDDADDDSDSDAAQGTDEASE